MALVTDDEFNAALAVMQKLLWADPQDRKRLQTHGLNLIPCNFYSSTPSISETYNSYEYNEAEPPYLNSGLFDQEKLRAELIELIPYAVDFNPAEVDDHETCISYFWKNGQFTCSDAMAYYAYVRRIRPKTIVEIGSGFSSLIALEALDKNGTGRLYCIEPFPRPFIKLLSNEGALQLETICAQNLTVEVLNSIRKRSMNPTF